MALRLWDWVRSPGGGGGGGELVQQQATHVDDMDKETCLLSRGSLSAC